MALPQPRDYYIRLIQEKYAVEPASGCWLWTAALSPGGWGLCRFPRDDKLVLERADRALYEITHGKPLPLALIIVPRCGNPTCVNPEHFEIVKRPPVGRKPGTQFPNRFSKPPPAPALSGLATTTADPFAQKPVPAGRRVRINTEAQRQKIRAGHLIRTLQRHVDGKLKRPLTTSQVKAIEILLRKIVPDLTQANISGELTQRYVAEVPPLLTKADWLKKYSVSRGETSPIIEHQPTPALPPPAANGHDKPDDETKHPEKV